MKIIITDHGKSRILLRMDCRKNKIIKMVEKAWRAKGDEIKPIPKYILKKHCNNKKQIKYKYYLGYYFVFDVYYTSEEKFAKLVTVYNHKKMNNKNNKTVDNY